MLSIYQRHQGFWPSVEFLRAIAKLDAQAEVPLVRFFISNAMRQAAEMSPFNPPKRPRRYFSLHEVKDAEMILHISQMLDDLRGLRADPLHLTYDTRADYADSALGLYRVCDEPPCVDDERRLDARYSHPTWARLYPSKKHESPRS